MLRVLALGAVLGVWATLLAGCERPGAEAEIVGQVRDNDAARLRDSLLAGGDPDTVSRDGQPLLYIATGPRGGIDVLEVLLAGGADLEAASPRGRTALMNAAGWCDLVMVMRLLEAGADPMRTDDDNRTARDSVCAGPLDLRADVLNALDAAVLGD